jgi:hypothetical protein
LGPGNFIIFPSENIFRNGLKDRLNDFDSEVRVALL